MTTLTLPSERVLALDVSTTNVGWCRAQGETYIDSGRHRPAGKDMEERIRNIQRWLSVLFQAAEDSGDLLPEVLVVEFPLGSRQNPRTDVLLGMAVGAVLATAWARGIRTHLIHQAKVKATGFHKGMKANVALRLGKPVRDVSGDEADAVGLWQAYRAQLLKTVAAEAQGTLEL